MSQLENPEQQYYATLNQLFGITSITVILLCLLCLPFFNLSPQNSTSYLTILGTSGILVIIKYVWLKQYVTYDQGFFITDLINPIMTGMLISVSGRYGIYLFFLFFLQILGSLALFRFGHVLVSVGTMSIISTYLFFIADSFNIGTPETYVAGFVTLVVLVLVVIFSYFIVHEQVRVMAALNVQKSMFIQDVSHELRTPLTVIKSVSTILTSNDWFSASEQKKRIEDSRIFDYLQSAATDLETITERLSLQSRQKVSAPLHDRLVSSISKKSPKLKAEEKDKPKKKQSKGRKAGA